MHDPGLILLGFIHVFADFDVVFGFVLFVLENGLVLIEFLGDLPEREVIPLSTLSLLLIFIVKDL